MLLCFILASRKKVVSSIFCRLRRAVVSAFFAEGQCYLSYLAYKNLLQLYTLPFLFLLKG